MKPNRFLVGCGSGFSGDRLDVARPVADTLIARGIARGVPAALMFETLGERTLALAQQAKDRDPDTGYEPQLDALLEPVLGVCVEHGITILGNFGAANPHAAARRIGALRRRLGLAPIRIGVIEGDDIRDDLDWQQIERIESDVGLDVSGDRLIAANVYLGAEALVDAMREGAQVIVTGRVADPALALAPLIYHFGWSFDDWDRLAAGTLVGHLLECGAQVSGGYFADPGFKDVPDLANVGFPIAEVDADGQARLFKADHTGGVVSERTVKEQILYEIHDPSGYLTPDVVLDLTEVRVEGVGENIVAVGGARGRARPATLKTTISAPGGWLGEGEISYAGPNALARARLAGDVLRERLQCRHPGLVVRIELIGVISVFDSDRGTLAETLTPAASVAGSADVRLRLAVEHDEQAIAETAAREVLALYCNGPAGGGGVRWRTTPRIKTASVLVPREQVSPRARVDVY